MTGSSFTSAFGGPSPIVPADPSYEAITIAADTPLVWPQETTGGSPYVAKQIDVTASAGGLKLKMPPGNTGSSGPQTIISNVGGTTFTVTDTAGNAIAVIPATQSWLITLRDNSTANGSWRALQIASTTTTAVAAALAGLGLEALGPLLQTKWTTVSFAANDTITTAMRSNAVIWTGAVGTLQFQASATLTTGWFCAIKNDGTNTCTLQCTGGDTIDGLGSLDIHPGDSGIIILGPAGAFQTFGALITVLSVASGGTGASTAAQALVNLGGSAVGISVFTAPTAAAIVALLGLNGLAFTEASVATNQVLTSSSGNTMYVCTAALSITMPLSTSLTTAYVFMVDASGGAVALTPQVTDQINGGTAGVALTIPQGGYCLVCTDANGHWFTLFGPNATFTNITATAITTTTLTATTATATNVVAGSLKGGLRDFIAGGIMSAPGGGTTLTITSCASADSTNSIYMETATSYTKTTASFVVGSGNGMLDTGASGGAASTWYHVFQIIRPDTGVVDFLMSLSVSAPTLPANYTKFRRIGSIKLDGAKNIIGFSQNNDEFLWLVGVTDMNAVAVGLAAQTITLTVPRDVKVNAIFNADSLSDTAQIVTLFNSLDQTVAAAGSGNFQLCVQISNQIAAGQLNIRTNTAAAIRVVGSSNVATNAITLVTQGWIDQRGKNN